MRGCCLTRGLYRVGGGASTGQEPNRAEPATSKTPSLLINQLIAYILPFI
jgi:hypothetical protein